MDVGTTERLTIRHFTEGDHEFVITLLNDDAFLKNIGDKQVRTKSDAIDYLLNGPISSYKIHGFGLNIICLKSNDLPIGMCGLLKRPDFQHADLGYAFLPEYCGQGFAEEASTLVLENGHNSHHLEEVLAITLPSNIRSNHLLLKLGFTFTELVEYFGTTNNLYKIKLADQNDV